MEVLNYLKHQLKTVYVTTVGIGYELRVLCSVCHPTQPPHLHTLEKCLENDRVSCGKYKMNTSRFKVLFQEDIQDASLSKALPHRLIHGERMPEMSGMQFNAFKMVVSNWYDENRCLSMLKVLFRDTVDNVKLAEINKTIDLLNELVVHGKLSAEDPTLLYDTIRITGHFALQKKIQETLPSFQDVKEGTISTSFTPYRQKLMKLGKTLTTDNVAQIDGLYNTPRKMYTDSWSMITNLEDRRKISEGNMTDFINSLSLLKLPLALAALTEGITVFTVSNIVMSAILFT
ncbi:uncharacterized protein LOC117101480 isoform X1 [Anneissia japonica]|uniref:uncharacterized protein LOC117101480 isoform X1 n=1 Tax=Anneissia japonica TaxID=1529436 RepID=UPI0014258AFB|nr:uncharacterized protein LOC117101480 isoform X1 [Anneissia japonica]